jgi:hypothetical protein
MENGDATRSKKLLITSTGLNPQLLTYVLGDQQPVVSEYSSVALAELLQLQLQGYRSLVISTDFALETGLAALVTQFEKLNIPVHSLPIDGTVSTEHIFAVIEKIVENVEPESEVVLDVTPGLRHISFIYFAVLSYLVGLRKVKIKGIYYSAIDSSKSEKKTAHFIDLTSIFDLIEWYRALQAARDTGCLLQLSNLLEETVRNLFKAGERDVNFSKTRGGMAQLSQALSSVLPIEVGLSSVLVCRSVEQLSESYSPGVAGRLALRSLREQLEPWCIAGYASGGSVKKEDLQGRVTREELTRQLLMARWYFKHDNVPATLLLLREWLVSLVIYAGGGTKWLNEQEGNDVRKVWEAFPYHIKSRREAGLSVSEFELLLEKAWNEISSRRNRFAHAGMAIQTVSPSGEATERVLGYCEQLLAMGGQLMWDAARKNTVLICSLGTSPGVVYSALRYCMPDQLLVVTSKDSEQLLHTALVAAEMPNVDCRVLRMSDHVGGFAEHRALIDKEVKCLLGQARVVVGSITGGTTAMQYTVDRLIATARDFGPTVRKVALLDRRSAEEQRAMPYVQAEVIQLESWDCVLSIDEEQPVLEQV